MKRKAGWLVLLPWNESTGAYGEKYREAHRLPSAGKMKSAVASLHIFLENVDLTKSCFLTQSRQVVGFELNQPSGQSS